ncbi:MAG: putative TKL/IRAK protein kinase [Streblomastix strix]|uniref:Putative TKL/IRAK protein kinase n=1 Tax=Streblomastix strix TaxID=222440 RepID=A0A5J4VVQ9_9EUKA|nr:MAG: putative TKL/IRAK protein kinase [Streblomastix strix]
METDDFIQELLAARARDNDEEPRPDDLELLKRRIIKPLEQGRLPLNKLRLGVNSSISLAKGLKKHELKFIDLSNNIIGDIGCVAIMQLAQMNSSLTYLNVESNDIGNEGQAIGNMLSSSHSIETLLLGSPENSLHQNSIGVSGAIFILKGLEQNKSLRRLGINRNPIFGQAPSHVVGQPTPAGGGRDSEVAQLLVNILNSHDNLKELELGGTQMTTRACINICDAISTTLNGSVELLDFSHNTQLTFPAFESMSKMVRQSKTLTCLILDGVPLGARGGSEIAKALRGNVILEKLSLNRCDIEEYGVHAIATAIVGLKDDAGLPDEFDLAREKSARQQAQYQQQQQQQQDQLGSTQQTGTSNDGDDNNNNNQQQGTAGGQSYRSQRSQQSQQNQSPSQSQQQQQQSIQQQYNLETQTAEGVVNTTLTYLDLGHCQCGPVGTDALAAALVKDGVNLQTLILTGNNIGASAIFLADAMKRNTTVEKLDLSTCKIEDPGAEALANALYENNVITTLLLHGNFFSAACGPSLLDAMKTNTSVTTLTLTGSLLPRQTQADIAELCDRNQKNKKDANPNKMKEEIRHLMREMEHLPEVIHDLRHTRRLIIRVDKAIHKVENEKMEVQTNSDALTSQLRTQLGEQRKEVQKKEKEKLEKERDLREAQEFNKRNIGEMEANLAKEESLYKQEEEERFVMSMDDIEAAYYTQQIEKEKFDQFKTKIDDEIKKLRLRGDRAVAEVAKKGGKTLPGLGPAQPKSKASAGKPKSPAAPAKPKSPAAKSKSPPKKEKAASPAKKDKPASPAKKDKAASPPKKEKAAAKKKKK